MSLFNKKSIGVNIADRTIEVAEIATDGKKIKVLNLGRVHLEPEVIVNGRIKDKEKLKKYFQELFSKSKPEAIKTKEIIFGLPENQSYIHIFKLKSANKDSRDNLVLNEARTIIPINSENLIFSYRTLFEDKDSAEILLVATDIEYVMKWKMFCEEMGIKINNFDIGNFASFRNLFAKDPKDPVCVVNVGEFITNIDIFDAVGLRYSYTTNIAGNYFTTELAKGLEISEEEAENMKTKFGLTVSNKKAFEILQKSVEVLMQDIKDSIVYFEENSVQKIKEIIFLGGSSKMKGIVSFCKTSIGLKATRGEISNQFQGKVLVEYMGAVGLALRGLDKKWDKRDPVISISDEEYKKRVSEKKMKKEQGSGSGLFLKNESLEDKKIKRSKSQRIILIVILILGLISLGAAFWYRAESRATRATINKVEFKYAQKQTFNFQIKASLAGDNKTSVRVSMIEDIVSGYNNEAEAINVSKIRTLEKVGLEYNILLFSVVLNNENNNFYINWVSYPIEVTNGFFIKEFDNVNVQNFSYLLDSININKVENTADPLLYLILGDITVSLDTLIEIKEQPAPPVSEPEILPAVIISDEISTSTTSDISNEIAEVKFVTIKPTSLGWLNARSGPGTSYPIVTKLNPGDKYELIEAINGWSNIRLLDDSTVWISSQYAE